MIHYHLALAYKSKYQLVEMYKSLTLAKEYFLEYTSYRRLLYCDMNLATVYSRLGAVNEALNVYERCIKLMTSMNSPSHLKAMAYRNIAWIHIKNENYTQALLKISMIVEIIKTFLKS